MTRGSVLDYERYTTGGAKEWLLRIGEMGAVPVLFLPPLFEEMNRTRALIVAAMRLLAARGHDCWLIDLPGCGESERTLEDCDWRQWRQAAADAGESVAALCGAAPHVASFRGGALLDDAVVASSRWRLAPAAGKSLVRDLERASLVTKGSGDTRKLELAGYSLGTGLIAPLRDALPVDVGPLRTMRLSGDPGEADARLEGPALWRRSEPASPPALSAAIADDMTSWIRRCAGS